MQQVAKIRASKRIHLLLAWMASCRSATLACAHGTEKAIKFQAFPRDLKPQRGNKTSPREARGVEPSPPDPNQEAPAGGERERGARTDSLRSMPPLTTSRPLRDTTVTFIPAAPRWQQQQAAATSEARVWRCGRGGGVRRKRRRRGGEGVDGGRWRI